jgi:putative flippase GtrA
VLKLPSAFHEPSRYVVVGGLCAVLNNVILIGGDLAGLHYAVSILLTFVLVLPAAYLAHALWTFRTPASWQAFGRFIGGSVSSLVVASFAVWLFRGVLQLPMFISAPLATVVMTIYNYAMAKWAVAHRPANGRPSKLDSDDVAEAA